MSRSGYTDDIDDVLAYGRWRGQVISSIKGKRGQALLRELLIALDEMPDKELYPNSFKTESGEFCALGVLGDKRGVDMSDLIIDEYDCDTHLVAERFDISNAMACEIMFMNDEYFTTPQQRWMDMRQWIVENINHD